MRLRFLVLAGVILTVAGLAAAVPITMTFEGTGTGTVGATPFTDASFIVTLTIETDNNGLFEGDPDTPVTEWAPATVDIDGIGLASFSATKRVFCNQSAEVLGLNNSVAFDLIDIDSPQFATYDLTTGFGPVFDANPSAWYQFVNVPTNLGDVTFTDMSDVTFTAVLAASEVPMSSPTTSILLVVFLAAAGLFVIREVIA